MKLLSIFGLLAAPLFAQLPPTVPEPTNIDFSMGTVGQIPPGWEMPAFVLAAGYRAEFRREGCGRFPTCVAYIAPGVITTVRAAELSQTFPAAPYIGRSIRFTAWLRLDKGSDGGYVHIRMRIDYADKRVDMRDSIQPPVQNADWTQREVTGRVGDGAVSISIWARHVPSGFAWVASPTFEVIGDARDLHLVR